MKPLPYYEKQVLSLNIGQSKTERLLCVIRWYYRNNVEPNVQELAKLSRVALMGAKYAIMPLNKHIDNLRYSI